MLFNSYVFLFGFLPVVISVFFVLQKLNFNKRYAIAWLILSSLFFYGWWNPGFVLLLILSVTFNFGIGRALQNTCPKDFKGLLLGFGIVVNLAALGWFKYSFFLLENLSGLIGTSFPLPEIILPLGISFFTFQQIAYLVDCLREEAQECNFLNYFLF